MSGWSFHVDLTFIPLLFLAGCYLQGVIGFEMAVVLMLLFGLPYGGPAS